MSSSGDTLYNFGQLLTQQFNAGDNVRTTLNTPGQRYGQLGDFANQFDQTAERSYLEQGFSQIDPLNPTPKQLDILMQTPDITVFIKKRAFSSLAENYRPDLMDEREYAFLKTTKVLFNNKCQQIANYERLCKLARVSLSVGRLDNYLLPILFSLSDAASAGNLFGDSDLNSALSPFTAIVNRVREIVNLGVDSENTTWITNLQNSFQSTLGLGTGVIELTNVASLSTTTSVHFAGGGFNLSINDPYNLMLITNQDIEKAITDTNNSYNNNLFFQLGTSALNDTINLNKRLLNDTRVFRGASPIDFIVQPNNFLGQPIIALLEQTGFQIRFSGGGVIDSTISILTGSGNSGVNIDQSGLQGSKELGDQGLSPNEATIFGNIISEIHNQISLNTNSQNQTSIFNQDPTTTYVRKKLRLHYGSKLIVQPMDNVHIYIRSYKNQDARITAGLQSAFNTGSFMQNITSTVENLSDAFNVENNYSVEKSIYVGNDFPDWLWAIFRSWFMSDYDGSHVFAGVVNEATSTFDSGSGTYHVSVSGDDNAGYFKYGVVNVKPSLDVYNGPLYDPLTPFDIQFDTVTGFQKDQTPNLLTDNQQLLTSAFVRFKNGVLAGIPPTQNSYLIADAERPQNFDVRQVFYDPDGMVYRWKEGIGTLVLFGDHFQGSQIVAAPATTAEPFAGQDIMNIISLLISGEPYNYATFFKAVAQFDGAYFSRDPISNEEPANSYYRFLQNNLKYRNLIYGNFIPFKLPVVNEQTQAKMMYGQLSVAAFNSQLQDLLQQRAAATDKQILANNISNSFGGNPNTTGQTFIAKTLKNLDLQIQSTISNITQTLQQVNQPITIIGSDVSFDANSTLNVPSQTDSNPYSRKDLRNKIALLTRRLSWKVRANEDSNLLVVDDTYDKDYDIQRFEKSFINPETFRSTYATVADQINNVADKLLLEIFCNSQGHIEARSPKYNKIPSGVYYRMFQLSTELGIQIYPQFFKDLAFNQVDSLRTEIEAFEDQIRLNCLALGLIDDQSCINFITGSDIFISVFTFLSDGDTGDISNTNLITTQSDPDQILSSVSQVLAPVQEQTSISALSIVAQASIVQSAFSPTGGTANNPNQFNNVPQILSQSAAQTREQILLSRLQSKTGQTFSLPKVGNSATNGAPTSMDVLNILGQVSTLLQQRQVAVKAFANALQNVQESVQLDQDSSGANLSLLPPISNATKIPKVFEHMIEDEGYDDLGPGSHNRFTIQNHDIINWSLSEKRPPHTSIEVTGTLNDLFIQNSTLPPDLNVFENGSALTTVAAVDYDLWRMYGIEKPHTISAPFLNDPINQAPIYAVSVLNNSRAQVHSGTMTIVGNEYQQAGEVVYIKDLDRLYYVEALSHNFAYGQRFTTNLTLNYGHNPGEFIPTPIDVIGKLLYKNKDITNFAHKRQGSVFNQQHLGVIVGSPSGLAADDDIINGYYGPANRATIQSIINGAPAMLASNSNGIQPILEIRYFYNTDTSSFGSAGAYAQEVAAAAYDYLIGKNSLNGDTNPITNATPNSNNLKVFSNQIQPTPVNTSVKTVGEFRAPSSKAFYVGRDLSRNKQYAISLLPQSNQSLQQTQIDTMIYNYIADIWIYFGTTEAV